MLRIRGTSWSGTCLRLLSGGLETKITRIFGRSLRLEGAHIRSFESSIRRLKEPKLGDHCLERSCMRLLEHSSCGIGIKRNYVRAALLCIAARPWPQVQRRKVGREWHDRSK